MKSLGICLGILAVFSCKAQQTDPLRTFTKIPENAYLKDTNNEFPYY